MTDDERDDLLMVLARLSADRLDELGHSEVAALTRVGDFSRARVMLAAPTYAYGTPVVEPPEVVELLDVALLDLANSRLVDAGISLWQAGVRHATTAIAEVQCPLAPSSAALEMRMLEAVEPFEALPAWVQPLAVELLVAGKLWRDAIEAAELIVDAA